MHTKLNNTVDVSEKQITPATDGVVIAHKHTDDKTEKSVYIESYGCQMNFSDSEVVASILSKEGYQTTTKMETADLILVNTCSIREKAEDTVRKRLRIFDQLKSDKPGLLVGVLGCMAERV